MIKFKYKEKNGLVEVELEGMFITNIQGDSKLLSGVSWALIF